MELVSSKVHVKQLLIDESVSNTSPKNLKLFIQLGHDFLSLCILDNSRKKFICLEDFRFAFSENAELLAEKCELVKQQSKFLQLEDFQTVNCCVSFHRSTLIPEPLYDAGSEKLMLDFNFGETKDEIILKDHLKLIQTINLFSVPSLIHKMLNYWFKDISIHHQSTILINSLLTLNKYKQEKFVTLHVRPGDFEIAVTEGNKLLFYNSFQYKTNEDFLYFVLFVLEQLNLNPETVAIKVTGEIEKHNILYRSIGKYLQNVSIMEINNPYQFSYKFESLPASSYYTLFNQHLCES
jgi:hypothetical protein